MSADMIEGFGVPVVVKRMTTDIENVDGRYQPGIITDVTITASVQPMTPRETAVMDELNRTKEWIKVFASEELFLDRATPRRSADRVIWRGRAYKVMKVVDFSSPGPGFGIAYWRAEAVDAEGATDAYSDDDPVSDEDDGG